VKKELRFQFDYFACLWHRGAIDHSKLPISSELLLELEGLISLYHTRTSWGHFPEPDPWTKEQELDFIEKADAAYEKLKKELESEYKVTNNVVDSDGKIV